MMLEIVFNVNVCAVCTAVLIMFVMSGASKESGAKKDAIRKTPHQIDYWRWASKKNVAGKKTVSAFHAMLFGLFGGAVAAGFALVVFSALYLGNGSVGDLASWSVGDLANGSVGDLEIWLDIAGSIGSIVSGIMSVMFFLKPRK